MLVSPVKVPVVPAELKAAVTLYVNPIGSPERVKLILVARASVVSE